MKGQVAASKVWDENASHSSQTYETMFFKKINVPLGISRNPIESQYEMCTNYEMGLLFVRLFFRYKFILKRSKGMCQMGDCCAVLSLTGNVQGFDVKNKKNEWDPNG